MTTDDDREFYRDFNQPEGGKPPKPEHHLIDRSRWGLFPDMDLERYFAGMIDEPSLSQSGMRKLNAETPLDFAYNDPVLNRDAEKIAATAAQRRGDVVHQLALGKGRGYFILPDEFDDFKKKAAQELRDAAIERGETPVLARKFEEAEVMAEVIRDRIREALDGASYQTECAFLYQEMTASGPIWVRGLMDVWCEERAIILDPKVTGNLYDGKVEKHVVNMGWDLQGALYPHAVGMIRPELAGRIQFRDLMVKPEAPFTSRVVALSKFAEALSIEECQRAMTKFGKCLYAGKWPGFEATHYIDLPVYESKRREALALAGDE